MLNSKFKILNSILLILILYTVFYILYPQAASAAQIYFGTNSKEFGVGEKFEVGVFLSTQEDFINAVESKINFDTSFVEFQGIQNGNSIINLWVKQPYILSEGIVYFSGVLPGGYNGSQGYLFSLIFKAKKTGQHTINSSGESILLNDGKASAVKITNAPLNLSIIEEISKEPFVPLYDPDPPEAFKLYVSKEESVFFGKWFLTFATQDKGSGVDYYEVLEKPQKNSIFSLFAFGKEAWVKGESPYLLKDQNLKSIILVKAIDRAQNSSIAAISAANKLSWYENIWVFGIMILSAIISAIIFYFKKFLWNKIKR